MLFLLIINCFSQSISDYQISKRRGNFDLGIIENFTTSIMVNSVKIPYFSCTREKYDELTIFVPYKYGERIRFACEQQLENIMLKYFPDEYFKTDYLKKQLRDNKPEEIQFFKSKMNIVEQNEEDIESRRQSIFNLPKRRAKKKYNSEYLLYYSYFETPRALYQYYQCKKAGKSFAVTLRTRNHNMYNLIQQVESIDELPVETFTRTFNIIYEIMHSQKARKESKDYIENLYNAYRDFMFCEIDEKREINEIKENISSQVKKYLSKPTDILQPSVNVYGVQFPIVAIISYMDKDILYMNRDQVNSIIKNLREAPDYPFIIFRVVIFTISLFLSFVFNGKKLRNHLLFIFCVFFIFSIIYILNQIGDSAFEKCLKALLTFKSEKIDDIDSMIKREKKREKGRLEVRKMIVKYVNGRNNFYLLKAEMSKKEGFDIINVYDFD